MTPGARGALRVLAATAMLVVAAAATVTAPTEDEVQTPMESVGPTGRTVVSRLVEARADGVRVARTLRLPAAATPRDSATLGAWVVVDVTVACRVAVCGFGDSELRLGERAYAPSAIVPGLSFAIMAVNPGLRYRTSAVFEVPRSALSAGRARLAVQSGDTANLDGVAVITVTLPRTVDASAAVRAPVLVGAAR